MTARIFPIFGRAVRTEPRARDWSTQELAEFYRVEAALIKCGMRVESDRGLTDEGDPWFVFCRADDKEVIAHFARVGIEYVVASNERIVRGVDFRGLIGGMLDHQPLIEAQQNRKDSNVILHPTALLVALVAMAFFKTSDLHAANKSADDLPSSDHADPAARWFAARASHRDAAPTQSSESHDHGIAGLSAAAVAVIASAIALVLDKYPLADVDATNDEIALTAAAQDDRIVPAFGTVVAAAEHQSDRLAPPDASASSDESGPDQSQVTANQLNASADGDHSSIISITLDSHNPTAPRATLQFGDGSVEAVSGVVLFDDIHTAQNKYIVISLSATATGLAEDGASGSAEAVHLSFDLGKLAGVDQALISHLNQLPDAFVSILDGGLHHAALLGATSFGMADFVTAHVNLSSFDVNSPGTSTQINPIVAIDTAPLLDAGLTGADAFRLSAVQSMIQQFEAAATQIKVVIVGQELIIYDSFAVDHNLANVRAVTFDFNDGTSISLVGLAHDLPQALI